MSEPASTNSNLTTIGVLLIVIGLGYSYALAVPQLKTINVAYQQSLATEKAKATDLDTLQKAQNNLAIKEAQLQTFGVTKTSLDSVFPPTEDMPGLYLLMESLVASPLNVTKATYELGKPATDTAGQVKIPVTITGIGKYVDLKGFMYKFETTIRPVTFSTVSLTQAIDDSKDGAKTTLTDQYQFSGVGYIRASALSPAYAPATPSQPSL